MTDVDVAIVSFLGTYILLFVLIFAIGLIINWLTFKKLGITPWYGLIPIWDQIVLFKKFYGNALYFLFLFVPVVNIWFAFGVTNRLGKAFSMKLWTRVLFLMLTPFGYLYIALSSRQYNGMYDEDELHTVEYL